METGLLGKPFMFIYTVILLLLIIAYIHSVIKSISDLVGKSYVFSVFLLINQWLFIIFLLYRRPLNYLRVSVILSMLIAVSIVIRSSLSYPIKERWYEKWYLYSQQPVLTYALQPLLRHGQQHYNQAVNSSMAYDIERLRLLYSYNSTCRSIELDLLQDNLRRYQQFVGNYKFYASQRLIAAHQIQHNRDLEFSELSIQLGDVLSYMRDRFGNDPETARTLYWLARLASRKGQVAATSEYYQRAITMLVEHVDENYFFLATLYSHYSGWLLKQGKIDLAMQYWQKLADLLVLKEAEWLVVFTALAAQIDWLIEQEQWSLIVSMQEKILSKIKELISISNVSYDQQVEAMTSISCQRFYLPSGDLDSQKMLQVPFEYAILVGAKIFNYNQLYVRLLLQKSIVQRKLANPQSAANAEKAAQQLAKKLIL